MGPRLERPRHREGALMLHEHVAAAAARKERLLVAVVFIVPVAGIALVGFVVAHFVIKFW
jgi:hypothetical protein